MRLIDEARNAWRLLSVQIPSIGIAACTQWLLMTDEQRNSLLALLHISPAWVVMLTFVASIVGRLFKQGGK